MGRGNLIEEALTHSIIGAFFEVYNTLGFGFLEHAYVMALERELLERGHSVAREFCVRISYKGYEIANHRLDMVVDSRVIVEAKSTVELHKAADRQVYNYLKATPFEVGLLLHYGPKPAFRRMICRHAKNDAMYPLNRMYPVNPSSSMPAELDESGTPHR